MTDSLVSLLLPTRARPALALRLFDSIQERTRHLDRVEVVLYVDEDDLPSHSLNHDAFKVKVIIGPRLSMGGYNTACLANADGQIIILINDDMVIRTSGWDEVVRGMDSRFPDKIYLAYGNDLFKGEKLCSFPILSRRTCEVLVEPFPDAYRGAFIDYHLLDIFKRVQHAGYHRICYLEHLIFEHMHYRTGKAQFDATYQKRDRFADDPVFLSLRDLRSAAARRLCAHIENKLPETADPGITEPVSPRPLIVPPPESRTSMLRDRELPFRWRSFLFFWFCGRYLASRWYRAVGARGSPPGLGNG